MKNRSILALLSIIILVSLLTAGCGSGRSRTSYKWERSNKWTISRHKREAGSVPVGEVKLVVNDRVNAWIDYFTGPGRERFGRYLQRSGRYKILMIEILREQGLPDDVFHIALIESGFTASARSHAGAVGFWQFIRSTGKNYGLRIDPFVDERMDPEKSTRAAANYLKDLYNEFGDWYLAFAGYNSGEGKVRNAIKKYGTKDFWKMTARRFKYFRPETKDYVPKFIAATMIANNPKKYGFKVDYHEPMEFEYVKASTQADFEIIAKCSHSDYPTIATLNPELHMGVTPPGERDYQIRVPSGSAKKFQQTFAKLPANKRITKHVQVAQDQYHRVKRGETLSRIAGKYGISTRSLMHTNRIKSSKHLKIGQKLVIPGKATVVAVQASSIENQTSSIENQTSSIENQASKTTYTIKRGDTVAGIAGKFGVSAADLRNWNKIHGNKIIAGRKLKIYKGGSDQAARTSTLLGMNEVQTEDLRPKTQDQGPQTPEIEHLASSIESQKPSTDTSTTYKIKSGDTLWSIAMRNNMTVTELCQINNISRKAMLKPGMKLKVKAPSVGKVALKESAKSERLVLSSADLPPSDSGSKVIKYKVRSGDTAWEIAKKHNVSIKDIEVWNSDKNLKKIKPGDTIKLKLASNN